MEWEEEETKRKKGGEVMNKRLEEGTIDDEEKNEGYSEEGRKTREL
jgi:hypothetical protein